jgi:hypothetical protein
VIANLRLQVNQPADHAAAGSDPGALSPVQGYAAHYCNLDRLVDPTVVACSFITSGLRVFDISDLRRPKEIAYYVAPTRPRAENAFMASDFAMSQPAIVGSRREVWYTDGATGFNVLRVAESVWPKAPGAGGAGTRRGCLPRSAAVSRRGIGRVRLGMKRRALPAPRRKSKRVWSWCAKGGMVSAVFDKRGRVALVTSTARRHRGRGLRGYPHRRALGHGLVRAFPGSTRVFGGVRRGKARYVAIAGRTTIAHRALLRRYLRAALR